MHIYMIEALPENFLEFRVTTLAEIALPSLVKGLFKKLDLKYLGSLFRRSYQFSSTTIRLDTTL